MAQKKILVIDDEPNIVKMVQARLEASGYEVIVAFDGRQGLTHVYREKPDLIILDITMPVEDGYSICKRLKMSSETWSIQVIFLTAKDKLEDEIKGYEVGADYYLRKPYEPEILLETIKRALEQV